MLSILSNRRTIIAEIMDRPDLDPDEHRRALAGLRRINRVSRTAEQVLAPIIEMARRRNMKQISLMDVACGGGDVPVGVAIAAAKLGLSIDLTLLDRSSTSVGQAADTAARAGIRCRTIEADILQAKDLPAVDVVTNSLFLHHMEEPERVVAVLKKMGELARRMGVVSDLRRSRRGLIACWIGCHLLTQSRIVHHDGPVSVRASWTMPELTCFVARAQLKGARVESASPWRMLLTWERADDTP